MSAHIIEPMAMVALQKAFRQDDGSTDERQMTERLGEVAELTAIASDLFRKQTEMISMSEKPLKVSVGLISLASARQASNEPKRTAGKASLFAIQSVVALIGSVTIRECVFSQ